MTSESTHPDLFANADPRIFTTSTGDPESGRTFVYALTKWYERIEGETGAVAFSPVAGSEAHLREWLAEAGLEIDEISADDGFAWDVRDAFLEQIPLYPEAAEDSDQPVDLDQALTSAELGGQSSISDDPLRDEERAITLDPPLVNEESTPGSDRLRTLAEDDPLIPPDDNAPVPPEELGGFTRS